MEGPFFSIYDIKFYNCFGFSFKRKVQLLYNLIGTQIYCHYCGNGSVYRQQDINSCTFRNLPFTFMTINFVGKFLTLSLQNYELAVSSENENMKIFLLSRKHCIVQNYCTRLYFYKVLYSIGILCVLYEYMSICHWLRKPRFWSFGRHSLSFLRTNSVRT